MHYCIITSGPVKDEAAKEISGTVICADGGTDFAKKHGIIPSKVIGDLDSVSESGLAFISENNIPVEKYDAEKDWTDTEIALIGIPDGSDVKMVCPLGSRIDHMIGNIQIASEHAKRLGSIMLTDGITRVYVLNGKGSIEVHGLDPDTAVSLVPLNFDTGVAGVTTQGLYYRLEDATLTAGKTLSFCNKPEDGAESISVSIENGRLAVIVTKAV